MDVLTRVADFIQRHGLLRPGERVVAAVSGGPDSLCLLDCLVRLGYPVVVAHLDHQLRPDSREDAEFTLGVAQCYGLPAVLAREDVRRLARHGISIEHAARLVRYRFLARAAREHRASAIATGHTADDQAETVLMHFLRGAGPEGLRGMLPATPLGDWPDLPEGRGLRLVRPLLDLKRAETATYCVERGLSPRQDASNLDLAYLRNRLRHRLLPELEDYNPDIRDTLRRSARVMSTVADLVTRLSDQAWQDVSRQAGQTALALDCAAFGAQPEALQFALVRKAIRSLRPDLRDLPLAAVDRIQQSIVSPPPGGRASVAGGLDLWHTGREAILAPPGAAILLPDLPQLLSARRRRIPVPGSLRLACGWRLDASLERPGGRKQFSDQRHVGFDADALDTDLSLRPPRPGERLQPLGMTGSAKLSDLFVNCRVPRLARALWPVVAAGEIPLWVVGLRRARQAPVTRRTRRALVLRLVAPGEG
ncbi:MAG: tRNA lysidine(34) synthetase TilS [Chloroflexota bacterium]